MPEGLDCKYMLLKIPLNHFYQTIFLVYTLFLFSFLSECNLSDLWIPEAMEDLCCYHAHLSWFIRFSLFSFLSECNLSYLWTPEAMEFMLLSCPSFMVRQIFFVFLLV
jgi:hypothetical protein